MSKTTKLQKHPADDADIEVMRVRGVGNPIAKARMPTAIATQSIKNRKNNEATTFGDRMSGAFRG